MTEDEVFHRELLKEQKPFLLAVFKKRQRFLKRKSDNKEELKRKIMPTCKERKEKCEFENKSHIESENRISFDHG